MQDRDVRAQIVAMGTALGPDVLDRCRALFDAEQQALMARVPPVAIDCSYGPHPRHRLDLYAPQGTQDSPILLFVHGGGFRLGDKGDNGSWQNASVGRMAAELGCVGAVMNYRLSPDHGWPAGGEDVLAALHWLQANVVAFGGSAERIVLMGTSAGAVHVASALKLDPTLPARGLILLSGLYGYTPLDDKDLPYYGDAVLYPDRMPRDAVAQTPIPLLAACAQFDPPRFQAEFLGLIQDRLARHGTMPRAYVASGHNHYSMAMHLGTSDRRLATEIASFVRDVS